MSVELYIKILSIWFKKYLYIVIILSSISSSLMIYLSGGGDPLYNSLVSLLLSILSLYTVRDPMKRIYRVLKICGADQKIFSIIIILMSLISLTPLYIFMLFDIILSWIILPTILLHIYLNRRIALETIS
jgi:hypothetical protein